MERTGFLSGGIDVALTLIRHTRPAVEPGICYGRTDLALAPTFAEEAAAVLARLEPAAALVSSPLGRCRALAERIGSALHLQPAYDHRLQEMDFGAWEGQDWNDIPRMELDAWAADFLHARPHGGESVHAFVARVHEVLAELRKDGVSRLVVTHAGVIKASTVDKGADFSAFENSVAYGGMLRI